jgi:aspartate/methionine/tyrosine aminotransferase
VNIGKLIGRVLNGSRVNDADDFARIAQTACAVRVLSGVPFGSPKHIRVSFAVSQDALEEGFRRLVRLIQNGDQTDAHY